MRMLANQQRLSLGNDKIHDKHSCCNVVVYICDIQDFNYLCEAITGVAYRCKSVNY